MGSIAKEKIRTILEKSITLKVESSEKIEYKYYIKNDDLGDLEEKNENKLSKKEIKSIDSPSLDVKNIEKFPFISIGTLLVKFPISVEEYFYTCFIIGTNIVVTLASNLIDEKRGGKANSIKTTFSDEKIKWENIKIQAEDNKEEKKDSFNKNLKSHLAVILYEDNIVNEWIGLEQWKKEDLSEKDIYCTFSLGLKNNSKENKDDFEYNSNKTKSYLREINLNNGNPFIDAKKNLDDNEIVKKCPGSPCYYNDYNGGAYVIAIVNEFLEIQYFDIDDMIFLNNSVYQGKLLKKKIHKGIDEENIIKLDLSRNDFGPLDIKYLTDFDLKNLKILDLSSNSILPQGAFYLSLSKFSNLESLNLNFNDIGDEGLYYISNGNLNNLNYLYLFHCNISFKGIQYLVNANFTNNLIILSLSENTKIGDRGIEIFKEHKEWTKLNTLNLNASGITDISLEYIKEANIPNLKKLNILGNNFTDNAKATIKELRQKNIKVSYRTEKERKKELEDKKNNGKEKDEKSLETDSKIKNQNKSNILENELKLVNNYKFYNLNKFYNY